MLEALIRSNAVDKRWAEELIAGAGSLEQTRERGDRDRGQPLAHPTDERRGARAGSARHGAHLTAVLAHRTLVLASPT